MVAWLLWLGCAPSPVAADDKVGGAKKTLDDVITSSVCCDLLVSLTATFAANTTHRCVVTASAEALNPNTVDDNQYEFGLSHNAPGVVGVIQAGSARTIDFDNTVHSDEASLVVATTDAFTITTMGVAEDHEFRFIARKVAAADSDMTVTDASITAVCLHGGNGFSASNGEEEEDE